MDPDARTFHGLALSELEVFLHVLLRQRMLFTVYPLGNSKDQEEAAGKSQSGNRGNGFGKQVHDCGCKQDHEYGSQSEWNFASGNGNVWRDLPAALAFVLKAQDQH